MHVSSSLNFSVGESDGQAIPLLCSSADAERVLASLYVSKKAIREEADSYPAVVFKIGPNWRLIVCKDAIQWIIQNRSGSDNGEPRWRGQKYSRTKVGLLRSLRDCELIDEPMVQWMVSLLPERL